MRLELKDITKRFPGVLANDRISIAADRGEVLGLLGENGAGKSTLMNILSGLYRPDSGEILIDGTPRTFTDPRQAIDAGIGMVHQHFQLVPVFDVVEAVALGAESVTGLLGTFDRKTARKRVADLSEQYSLNVNPDARIEDLPVGVRQRVEILKALYRQSDILVLDEPSAVLTPFETEELFGIIRGLAEAGHDRHLHHPQAQRGPRGRGPDHGPPARQGRRDRGAEGRHARDPRQPDGRPRRGAQGGQGPGDAGCVVLSIKDLHVRDDREHMAVRGRQPRGPRGRDRRPRRRPGQRPDRARGGHRRASGPSTPARSRSRAGTSPAPRRARCRDLGVAHVPEDRMRDGLIGAMTVAENFILDTYHREPYSNGGRAQRDGDRGAARRSRSRTTTSGRRRIDTYAGSLSGGNQQKVVVAREFARPVKLVIAAQPTRGLDVGSIEYIHRRIVEQRDAGAAMLIVSTELDEVLAVGDRVAVMQGGQIVGIVEGEEATYEKVGMLMGGVH